MHVSHTNTFWRLTCAQCNTEFWGLPQEVTIFKAIFLPSRLWAYRWQSPPLKTEKWWLHLRKNSGQRKEIVHIKNVWIAYDWPIQAAKRQQLGQYIVFGALNTTTSHTYVCTRSAFFSLPVLSPKPQLPLPHYWTGCIPACHFSILCWPHMLQSSNQPIFLQESKEAKTKPLKRTSTEVSRDK